MPRRKEVLATNEVYHVLNRSVGSQPIFGDFSGCTRMVNLIDFYRFEKPGLRFSYYNHLPQKDKKMFLDNLRARGKKLIEIYAFCLMPNHFHLLLKQVRDGGIARFMRNVQNAYAKYFNIRNERFGSLFQLMFKVIRIETDEQFIHVARYVHLNPATDYLVKEAEELKSYRWGSFGNYIGNFSYSFIEKDELLRMFGSKDKLIQFTLDQVDYQRKLAEVKHLTLEEK